MQVQVAYRPAAGPVIVCGRLRQQVLPQRRYQRRGIIVVRPQRQDVQPGGVAQRQLPVGVFLRCPVVQRIGAALELIALLQCGKGLQHLLAAVNIVEPLHGPPVIEGIVQLHPSIEGLGVRHRPGGIGVGDQPVQSGHRSHRLPAAQRYAVLAAVAVAGAVVLPFIAVNFLCDVIGDVFIAAAVVYRYRRHLFGGGHPSFKAHSPGKDDAGVQGGQSRHSQSDDDASAGHALKAPAQHRLHQKVDQQAEHRDPH